MNESYKCKDCHRFLTESSCREGWARIQCPKCKTWQVVRFSSKPRSDAPSHLHAAGI